jgi:Serine/Threonine/Tyrosine Kinase found in polyvalent proteins
VVKINDAIYYATWLEYFNSMLLHNLIFKDTAYQFLGFIDFDNVLHAVVKQPFIIADVQAALYDIRDFLEYNGFKNTRRHDYFNKTYGLILEDMHDENVIIKSEKLFFYRYCFLYSCGRINTFAAVLSSTNCVQQLLASTGLSLHISSLLA